MTNAMITFTTRNGRLRGGCVLSDTEDKITCLGSDGPVYNNAIHYYGIFRTERDAVLAARAKLGFVGPVFGVDRNGGEWTDVYFGEKPRGLSADMIVRRLDK